MSEILTDLSPAALASATKANLYALYDFLKRAPQTDFFANNKLIRWCTRIGHPWFNGVLCAQAAQEGDESTVNDAIAYFQSRNMNAFTWWLAPELSLSSWEPLLQSRGFIHDANTPGMTLDLHTLADEISVPAGLHIAPVTDAETLRLWAHTFILGYGLPPDWELDLFDLQYGLGLEWPMQNYLAWLDNAPVAASNLFLAAGVAGIFDVATLPEARHKGIGGAVTAAALRDAREKGYRVATLQASDMGYSVYHRLGFRTICQMDHFFWSRDTGGI